MKTSQIEWLPSELLRHHLDSRFSDIEIVASGATSLVAKANDRVLGRAVALKIFHSGAGTGSISNAVRESRVLSSLNHPGVIRLLDRISVEQDNILVLQFCKFGSVDSYLRTASIQYQQKILLLQRAFASLHYLHKRGWIHGDIKPANLLVHDNGVPLWCDLGSAVCLSVVSKTKQIVGSIGYIAPEIASQSASVSVRSDLYSLSIMVYEILAEKRAFPVADLNTHAGRDGQKLLQLPRLLRSDLPDAMDWNSVLRKASAHSQEDRYASVLEFWEDIERIQSKLPIRAYRISWFVKLWKWSYREKRLTRSITVTLVSILSIAFIAGFSWTRSERERRNTITVQRSLNEQVEKSKGSQLRLAELVLEAEKSLQLATLAEKEANDVTNQLQKDEAVLNERLGETSKLLEANRALDLERGEKYSSIVSEKWNASQRFLNVVPEIQIELVEWKKSANGQKLFDSSQIKPQRRVPTRVDEDGKSVFQNKINAGFRLDVYEPEFVFSNHRLKNAMEDLRLKGADDRVKFGELGIGWESTQIISDRIISKAGTVNQRLQVGRVYEIGTSNSYQRFRVHSINGKTQVAIPDELRKRLQELKFAPERLVILQSLSNELEADVLGGSMPLSVAQAINKLVKRATYENVKFIDAIALPEPSRLQELLLIGCDFPEQPDAKQKGVNPTFGPLGNLEQLTISRCKNLPRSLFSDGPHDPKLANVRIIHTELLVDHLKFFSTAPQLKTLWINDARMSNDLVSIIARSTSIEFLAVSACKAVNADVYSAIAEMPALLELELAGNSMSKGDWASIGKLKTVLRLGLHDNELLDNQMEGIAQLDCLIGLSLGGNHQISDAVIKSLCMCTQLREIAVDGTDVTDHFLQEIVKLPFLKQLYITNTRITQEAVAFAKEQSSRIQVISKKLPSSKTRGNAVGSAVARYDYGGGCFEQTGNTTPKIWIEYKVGNIANFQFEEKHRTESEVSIFDKSRNFTIRFPRQGGMAQLSKDGEKTWKGLYMLSKSTNIVSRPPTNLLRSVDSKGGWQHTVLASSAGTMSQGSGAMVLETTRLGTEPWHVQVYSSSIRLEEGRSYRVILTAKSPTGVTAELIAGQAGGKYSEVGLRKRITLTPEYKTYEFSFVVEGQGIEKSRLGLHLGVAEGVVQVQSLALIPQ